MSPPIRLVWWRSPLLWMAVLLIFGSAGAVLVVERILMEAHQQRIAESLRVGEAILAEQRDQLALALYDYTVWDDMADKVGLPERPDREWLERTLSETTLRTYGLSLVAATTRDGALLFARTAGGTALEPAAAQSLRGAQWQRFLAAASRPDGGEAVPPVAVIALGGRLCFCAVNAIRPEEGERVSGRLLLFGKWVDATLAEQLLRHQSVGDAGFAPAPAGDGRISVPLAGPDGAPALYLQWRPETPTSVLTHRALVPLAAISLGVFFIAGIIAAVAARSQRELAGQRAFLRQVIDLSPTHIYTKDAAGRFTLINRAVAEHFGHAIDELLGRSHADVCAAEETVARLLAMDREVFDRRAEQRAPELLIPRADGGLRCFQVVELPVADETGRVTQVLGVGTDITERKEAEEAMRLAAGVFDSVIEGIVVTDLDGTILAVNPAFGRITGYRADEALGQTPRLLKSNRHDTDFYRTLWGSLLRDGYWQGELWNRRKDGEVYLEWLTISVIPDAEGRPLRYVGVFSDITEQRRKDERIRHLAYYDVLTDLPNRILFLDRLAHAIEGARGEEVEVAVLLLDVDQFKLVNDSLGHDRGDQLLCAVARRLGERVGAPASPAHTLARLGGDEFALILERCDSDEAVVALVEEVRAAFAEPFQFGDRSLPVTVSVGIGLYPRDGDDATALMRGADAALNAAKEAGRDTFRFCDPQMNARAGHRLELEAELRRAIAEDQFELFYQPKVRLADDRPVGLEALVRWNHPSRGLVPPLEFIPLAEETGLIARIGDRVLELACEQLARWRDEGLGELHVAVNVSARQLGDPALAERIGGLLAAHRLDPRRLEVEVTESAVMADPDRAIALLEGLRDAGIAIAMDDFGTGYSSLSYLRRLPIATLKIDRAFVKDLPEDGESAEIVRAVISLGSSLGLTLVAEGVESAAQVAFLRAGACHLGQGFHYSRPLPAAEATAWLRERIAAGAD